MLALPVPLATHPLASICLSTSESDSLEKDWLFSLKSVQDELTYALVSDTI